MLEKIVSFISSKEWDINNFVSLLNQWLALLIKSIDLTKSESKNQIEELISKSQWAHVWPDYDAYLNEKV